eukprot:1234160-Heterocapsa_arctica.AAC.1
MEEDVGDEMFWEEGWPTEPEHEDHVDRLPGTPPFNSSAQTPVWGGATPIPEGQGEPSNEEHDGNGDLVFEHQGPTNQDTHGNSENCST